MHIPYFRIFYSTSLSIIALIVIALTLISPGDHIRQSLKRGRLLDVFLLAGIFFLTIVSSAFIYAVRLFTVRKLLAAIPKEWSPFEKDHANEKVRRLVERGLRRSLCIAREARPRDIGGEGGLKRTWEELGRLADVKGAEISRERIGERPTPPWGIVSHLGWSSPSSTDLPGLQFMPVILELPNLIEAKAVSLAPSSVSSQDEENNPTPGASQTNLPTIINTSELLEPNPDPLAIQILQRPSTMNLRDYLSHLSALNLISAPDTLSQFLCLYERARFSSSPPSEVSFRKLMSLFAALLGGMETLNEDAFIEAYAAAAAAASEEGSGRVSLYSTTSQSSSSCSFITTGDVPARHLATAAHDGPHDVRDVASIRTTSTVAHHLPSVSRTSSSALRPQRADRPPLQSYITNSSYQSARAGLRTPSVPSSCPTIELRGDGSLRGKTSLDGDSIGTTSSDSVIRLSEEGGWMLNLPTSGDDGVTDGRNERGKRSGDDDDDDDVEVDEGRI